MLSRQPLPVAALALMFVLPTTAQAAPIGDMNCDGEILSNDIIMLARIVVGIDLADSTDNDGDGIHNGCDNCPDTANSDQVDVDQEGTGDACQDTVGLAPYDAGHAAGAASVDITANDQAVYDNGFTEGAASVDITTDNPSCDWTSQVWNGTACENPVCTPDDGVALTDSNFSDALTLWFSDEAAATATYGHISDWNVSAVTNMQNAFKDRTTFNDDIGAWDVSNVTSMWRMFDGAQAFNQDLPWNVGQNKFMGSMFYNAASFDRDI